MGSSSFFTSVMLILIVLSSLFLEPVLTVSSSQRLEPSFTLRANIVPATWSVDQRSPIGPIELYLQELTGGRAPLFTSAPPPPPRVPHKNDTGYGLTSPRRLPQLNWTRTATEPIPWDVLNRKPRIHDANLSLTPSVALRSFLYFELYDAATNEALSIDINIYPQTLSEQLPLEASVVRQVDPNTGIATTREVFNVGTLRMLQPGNFIFVARAVLAGYSDTKHAVLRIPVSVRAQPTTATAVLSHVQFNNGSSPSAASGQVPTFILSSPSSSVSCKLVLLSRPASLPSSLPEASLMQNPHIAQISESSAVSFPMIIFHYPGEYVVQLSVDTPQPSSPFVSSTNIKITVTQAPPTRLVALAVPSGLAMLAFPVPPVLTLALYDDVGLASPLSDPTLSGYHTHFTDAHVSLRVTIDSPSIIYTTRKSNPTKILGENVINVPLTPSSGAVMTFTNFSIDSPGRHQLTATVVLKRNATLIEAGGGGDTADLLLTTSFFVSVNPLPTFSFLKTNSFPSVNTPFLFVMHGSLAPIHNYSAALKISSSEDCGNEISALVPWPSSSISTLIPTEGFDPAYLCFTIDARKAPLHRVWLSLAFHYAQKFTENIPVVKPFRVDNVGECVALSKAQALTYTDFGWPAETGRRYGCSLDPPVGGTVAPCSCPVQLVCEAYTHASFTPSTLDVGRCVCCAPWVMAVAWILGTCVVGVVAAVVLGML